MTNKQLKEDLWDKVSNWTIQGYGCELEKIDPNNQIFEDGDVESKNMIELYQKFKK